MINAYSRVHVTEVEKNFQTEKASDFVDLFLLLFYNYMHLTEGIK